MPKVFEWNGYKFFFFSNEGIRESRAIFIYVKVNNTRNFG